MNLEQVPDEFEIILIETSIKLEKDSVLHSINHHQKMLSIF